MLAKLFCSALLFAAISFSVGFSAQDFATAFQRLAGKNLILVPVSEHGTRSPSVAHFPCLLRFETLDSAHSSGVKSSPIQHSIGHVACAACEAARQEAMQEAEFGDLPFSQASQLWLASRSRIAPATKADYEKNLKRLEPFFGAMRLRDIHIGNLMTYRHDRVKVAGPSRVNHEMSTMQQILKRAGTWTTIAPWYEPLPLPRVGPGIALTDEQEERLFRVAATKKRWMVAFCASLITANTTAGPEEIRMLQLKDVSIQDKTIYIRDGAKNGYRIRALPLNDDALWAVRQLLDRAKEKGATEPEHYLLPHRAAKAGEPYDVTRPMDSWKKAWSKLRDAAGLPRLRRYDLRHSSITKLLSNPAIPFSVTQALAGHVSRRMTDHYYHGTLDAKRDAVSLINCKRSPGREVQLRIVENSAKS